MNIGIKTKHDRETARESEIIRMKEKGWIVKREPESKLIVCRVDSPVVEAKVWKGSALKPHFFYMFKTIEAREKFLEKRLNDLREDAKERAASRKSPDASEHYAVGDVLSNSWGYDQTNVDWYQVTKVKAKSIWVRAIAQNSSDAGNCSYGYCQPRRNEFIGAEFRKTVQAGGYVSAAFGCMRKWDGKAKYCSSYH